MEILIYGVVGEDIVAKDVSAKLARGGPVTVRINSGGGIATEGSAIHSLLAAHKGGVEVVVEGIAASAASLIAMAGDTITMRDGAVMMVHDVGTVTQGDAATHRKSIERLDTLSMAYAKVYAKRSGKTVEECRALMEAETWFDGPEAVAAGFATNVDPTPAAEFASYDYSIYAKKPVIARRETPAESWRKTFAAIAERDAAFSVYY